MVWTIEDKLVIVTGANAGIGKATAEALAALGADVTIAVRNEAKGKAAAADIERSTGRPVTVAALDLSRLDSIRSFAADYVSEHGRLDVLVNNAGVMAGGRRETADGFEWTFGVNHLGPFLLTNMLLDPLRSSAPARIINLSSEAHRSARRGLDFDNLQLDAGYSSTKAYGLSKLANILFTVELERRLDGSGVTADAVHPGVVATSFGTGQEGPWWMGLGMRLLKPFLRTPAKGAATTVHLATAPDAELGRGLYWSDSRPAEPIAPAVDPDTATRLWDVSAKLVGLD